jgi:hypothetical protein
VALEELHRKPAPRVVRCFGQAVWEDDQLDEDKADDENNDDKVLADVDDTMDSNNHTYVSVSLLLSFLFLSFNRFSRSSLLRAFTNYIRNTIRV